jgi:hypothetical protein
MSLALSKIMALAIPWSPALSLAPSLALMLSLA